MSAFQPCAGRVKGRGWVKGCLVFLRAVQFATQIAGKADLQRKAIDVRDDDPRRPHEGEGVIGMIGIGSRAERSRARGPATSKPQWLSVRLSECGSHGHRNLTEEALLKVFRHARPKIRNAPSASFVTVKSPAIPPRLTISSVRHDRPAAGSGKVRDVGDVRHFPAASAPYDRPVPTSSGG